MKNMLLPLMLGVAVACGPMSVPPVAAAPAAKTAKKKKSAAFDVKKCVAKLKKAGYDVTEADFAGRKSPLTRFAKNGDAKAVKIMVDCGAELNFYESEAVRKTALTLAIEGGHDKVARMLIAAGAVPYYQSAAVNSLTAAASRGNVAIARELVQHGADVNERAGGQPPMNSTPLMSAVKFPEMVQFLIEAGADVNAVDRDKRTALHYAANLKSPASARLLLAAGAEVNAEDRDGYTPIFYAAKNNDVETVKVLHENYAHVGTTAPDGTTVFSIAEKHGASDVLEYLNKQLDFFAPKK